MNGVASLSAEARINSKLRELGCPGKTFVEIAKQLGARVATGPFSEALTGKKPFDQETGARLLEILNRMQDLRVAVHKDYGIEIDWSATSKIANALTSRLLASITHD